ncbi:MAG TPA: hypothetical protein VH877_13995 [Polyangia bacterium]|jgi:hypothetical protein|nr:hypothetical protein [Polyangia bacterium]
MDDKTRRDAEGHLIDVTPGPSGAPEAGGATTPGSMFGGRGLFSSFLRLVARVARSIEAAAYRRLRDLDLTAGEPHGARGRPSRTKTATFKGTEEHPSPA